MILLEAMACGTPTVATRVGCIPDIVRDRVSGFLLDNNDPETIARTVHLAMTTTTLTEVSDKARTTIESAYTYKDTVKRFEQAVRIMFPEVT